MTARDMKKAILGSIAAVLMLGGLYALYCGLLIWSGNVHMVVPGQLYRSAQLSPQRLATEIKADHIRSVLNLRGDNHGSTWYDNEVQATIDNGAAHYDARISARREVTPEQLDAILAILRNAPKPVLVHCASGSDRTGLITALYLYAAAGANRDTADRQMSLIYGHFPYLTSQSGAMDRSFDRYVAQNPPGPRLGE